MRLLSVLSFIVAAVMMTPHVHAGDDGLYAPKPPPGTAFVRFFNASGETVSANIGGKSYGDLAPLTASPYFLQSQGPVEFKTGLQSVPYKMEPDSFYTVIADRNGNPLIHKDTVTDNPAKAMIVLYNLGSESPLSLKAQDGLITVLDGVEKGKSAHRGINGAKVDFMLSDAAGTGDFVLDPVVLDRGRTYSIFYVGKQAVMIRGETDTTR